MGRLTTHVLDTASGRPGSGILIECFREGQQREQLASVRTNDDGRCDAPLLEDMTFTSGSYSLAFHVDEYFKNQGQVGETFLDVVVIHFRVSSPDEHYHVPLLLSPYGYTTYRGS